MDTPYKAVKFTKDDPVTLDTMNQVQANYQYIHDNAPRGRFFGDEFNVPVTENSRAVIICGRTLLQKNRNQDNAQASVQFGRAFAPECRPHVTTGIISTTRKDVFAVLGGAGGLEYPAASGFYIKLVVLEDNQDTDKDFWIAWHAFGFNTVEIA